MYIYLKQKLIYDYEYMYDPTCGCGYKFIIQTLAYTYLFSKPHHNNYTDILVPPVVHTVIVVYNQLSQFYHIYC